MAAQDSPDAWLIWRTDLTGAVRYWRRRDAETAGLIYVSAAAEIARVGLGGKVEIERGREPDEGWTPAEAEGGEGGVTA